MFGRQTQWQRRCLLIKRSQVRFLFLLWYFTLVERMRDLGRPRRRWEDSIRMDLEETGINARNWVDSTQDRDYCRALAALNLRDP